ncbi:MAG: RNA polymerase sigma factor [Planctomycetes bacterium]|nr:RNA polymerase sigma factor [Planctomycetota bacterium]
MTELPSPPCVDAAIEAAYRAACDRGYRLALAICGDAAKSEDVVHDVFARLLGRKDALRLETLDAYVARSVRNAAYDQVRGRAPLPLADGFEPAAEAGSGQATDPELVRAALSALPPEQREVIVLRVYEGLSFVQVARATGVPLGTVHSRYRYAIKKLRSLLRGSAQ